jgi:hypothetical protein
MDPSGWLIDEWELNKKSGRIEWLNDNKHYIEKDGQQIEVDLLKNSFGESINITKGILGQRQVNLDVFQSYGFSDAADAESFYYFVAGSSNVEWAFAELLYGNGHVGTDNNPGNTSMPGRYENSYGSIIKRMSHSHPETGGPPSYDLRVIDKKTGKLIKTGDLNNASNSPYNFQREVYDVPNQIIYGYDKYTYNKTNPSNNSMPVFDYKKNIGR